LLSVVILLDGLCTTSKTTPPKGTTGRRNERLETGSLRWFEFEP
jgi:hypothetical protein